MKKKLLILTMSLMCLSFAACGEAPAEKESQGTETESQSTEAESTDGANTEESSEAENTEGESGETEVVESAEETSEAGSEVVESEAKTTEEIDISQMSEEELMQMILEMQMNYDDESLAKDLAIVKVYEEAGDIEGVIEKYLVISFYRPDAQTLIVPEEKYGEEFEEILTSEERMENVFERMQQDDPMIYSLLYDQYIKYIDKSKMSQDIQNANTLATAFLVMIADGEINESVKEPTMITEENVPEVIGELPEVKGMDNAAFYYTIDMDSYRVKIYINEYEVYPDVTAYKNR